MQSHYRYALVNLSLFHRSAVLKFVSTIIGHEGEGSLLAFLRKK